MLGFGNPLETLSKIVVLSFSLFPIPIISFLMQWKVRSHIISRPDHLFSDAVEGSGPSHLYWITRNFYFGCDMVRQPIDSICRDRMSSFRADGQNTGNFVTEASCKLKTKIPGGACKLKMKNRHNLFPFSRV